MNKKVSYVSIINDCEVTVVFTDSSSETFSANLLVNGLNGEEVIYKRIEVESYINKPEE